MKTTTAQKRRRLRQLLAGQGFIVLVRNSTIPERNAYEAWAYEGPLDFAEATPLRFGLGANPAAALNALAHQLAQPATGAKTPPSRQTHF